MNFQSYSNKKNLEEDFYMGVIRILKSLNLCHKTVMEMLYLDRKAKGDKIIVLNDPKSFLIKTGPDYFYLSAEGRI